MPKFLIIGAFLLVLCLGCSKPTEFAGDGSQTGNARGTLVVADGAPAEGVEVYLRPSEYLPDAIAKMSARNKFRTLAFTTTDSFGNFSFESIAAGTYMLECIEPEGNTGAQINLAVTDTATVIELATDTLKPFGSIAGQIQFSESLDVSRIRVLVYGLDRVILPDSSGAFVIPNLPEGNYDLRFVGPDISLDLRGNRGVSVVSGHTTDLPASHTALNESGLVGYWPFDENSGQYAHDASGHGNNGILGDSEHADSMDPVWAAGKIGSGLQFDEATNTRVIVDAVTSSLDSLAAFTYTAWINPTGYGNYGRILSRELNGDSIDEFEINLTGSDWQNLGTGTRDINGQYCKSNSDSSTIVLNTWQHVAVTFDDAGDRTFHLFINGMEAAYIQPPLAMAAPLRRTSNPLMIGNCVTPNKAFIGKIDEVKVHNRVLSQSEILAEVNRQ